MTVNNSQDISAYHPTSKRQILEEGLRLAIKGVRIFPLAPTLSIPYGVVMDTKTLQLIWTLLSCGGKDELCSHRLV
jgi:hypothetical protein